MYNILTNNALFNGFDADEIEKLFSNIIFRKRKYSAEHIIAQQGDKYIDLMIILSGNVRGEMTDSTDKVINIENMEAPKPIAFVYLFGTENNIPVDIIANEDTEILFIPKLEVFKIINMAPKFAINYLNTISTKANFLANKIRFLNFKVLKEKIAKHILNLPKENNIVILKETQQQLAEILGVTRSSLAREFSNMQKGGILKIKNREVEILNESVLINMAKNQ